MSETVKLKSADGHELDAYVARPAGEPIAGLVVIQEIFGVNQHIRSIVDGYAKDGFLAVAPALFDRVERGVELAYEGPDSQKGVALMQKLDLSESLSDVDAALAFVRAADRQEVRCDWLLFWRPARMAECSAAHHQTPRWATMRVASGILRQRVQKSQFSCTSENWIHTYLLNKWRRYIPHIPKWRLTGTKAQDTVSIAICERATTPTPQSLHAAERWHS